MPHQMGSYQLLEKSIQAQTVMKNMLMICHSK
jgi:hypothetical protein